MTDAVGFGAMFRACFACCPRRPDEAEKNIHERFVFASRATRFAPICANFLPGEHARAAWSENKKPAASSLRVGWNAWIWKQATAAIRVGLQGVNDQ
ncbi:hypothetical protein [Luteimonas cucumeris]|uniref:hypothetical protein n=1 Tax=Luteimonas cucumeris TaxID=985012 RepID=UPI00119EDFD7|nr:hypothetical protein [Luteimonas cucumeris]